jgi:polysaccharide biosynthesis protein PslH
MRILHLTPELPYVPGGGGGATRQFHLLRRLVERGHSVTVVAPATAEQLDETHAPAILADAGVDLRPAIRPARPVAAALGVAREPRLVPAGLRWPLYAWQFNLFWASMRNRVRESIAALEPDVITVEHDDAAGWVSHLPARPPRVLMTQNVSWKLWQGLAARASALRASAFRLEAARHRAYVREHVTRFDAVVAVSGVDADELRALGASRLGVIPNGAACDELSPAPDSPSPPTLLFTGSMHHPPNPNGVRWFADEVWPAVIRELPQAKLVIVGRGPQRKVRPLAARQGIEVVGPVPSMAPHFERATAVVVPLLSGSGTRLKILEALASGRAVLSTTVGAEGLELAAGTDLLVEDDPERFARAAVRLLTDAQLRGSLVEAGRAAVLERYDWRQLGDRLERVLADVAQVPVAATAEAWA